MNSVSDMQNALKRVCTIERASARFAYERAVSTARIQECRNFRHTAQDVIYVLHGCSGQQARGPLLRFETRPSEFCVITVGF